MSFDTAQLVTSYGNFKAEVVSFQGELMELNLIDYDFNVVIGNLLTCIYHNNYMESRLIRKIDNQLFLFIPQPTYSLFEDRRTSHRIHVTSTDDAIHLNDDYHLAISSEYLSIVPHIKIIN